MTDKTRPVRARAAKDGPTAGADAARPGERVLTRTCRHCGATFDPVRDHQVFCRPSCRRAHFKVNGERRLPLLDLDDLFSVKFE
jgi:hypothetical protein